ncbi:unnamed protein product [Boreogadus saida]
MPLYSDISGTETGKCTDCTADCTATHAPRDASGQTVRTETDHEPVAREASCTCVGHPCTPEPRDASGRTVRTETEQEPVATEASSACVCHRHLKPTGPISQKADEPDTLIIGDSTIKDITGKKIKRCYFPDVMATFRAQVEKKRDYSLSQTSTLPLSDTQIADSPQTLKRDNSPPDAIDTVPSPIADAGLARNGHPPPLHSPIDDDLQPHLSHSHNNSSSTVSSLCVFPAKFKESVDYGVVRDRDFFTNWVKKSAILQTRSIPEWNTADAADFNSVGGGLLARSFSVRQQISDTFK